MTSNPTPVPAPPAPAVVGAVALICPECHEAARAVPPLRPTAGYGSPPAFSHHDGEPLCPVMGDEGYEPARAVPGHPDTGPHPSGPTGPRRSGSGTPAAPAGHRDGYAG